MRINLYTQGISVKVISHARRVQALDKIAAYMTQAVSEIGDTNHIFVLDLERDNNKISSCKTIFEIISAQTNEVLIIGENDIHDEAVKIFRKQNVPIYQIESAHELSSESVNKIESSVEERTNLFIQRNAIDTPVGKFLYEEVLKKNGQVLRFFKSLHDKDSGLTANHISFKGKAIKSARYTMIRFKNLGIKDYLLVHGREFEKSLENARVFYYKKKRIAYPLALPAWKSRMQDYGKVLTSKNKYVVSLFVRGNVDKRPQNEQILPTDIFNRQLRDVMWCFDKLGKDVCFIIKPHPNQGSQELIDAVNSLGERNVSISYDPPSLLASYSNLSIGMSTSAILDALFLGKPSIDFSKDSQGRRAIHPRGSLVQIMGIPSVDNKQDLLKSIKNIIEGDYKFPNLEPFIGNQIDIGKILIK